MSTHSRLAPSKSHCWVPCTASIEYIEANEHRLPPDVSSEAADEGTRAHTAATALLLDPAATPPFDNDEMAGYVGDFVDFVRGLMQPGDTLYVARRVSLFYLPSQTGEMDVAIVSKDRRRITMIDLKYGRGVGVYAKQNPQLVSYSESLLAELELIEDIPSDALINLIIYQPRDLNDPEAVRQWAVSRQQLADFAATITKSALTILEGGKGVFQAGDHCDKGFCRARGICKHYAARGLEVLPEKTRLAVVDAGSPELALPDPGSLTREQRVRVVKGRKALEKWMEAVEDQEVAELLAGAPRMGLKLVEGKSNRQWADEEAVEKLLRNHLAAKDVRPPGDLVSPAASEKLLKKAEKALKAEGKELSTKFWNALTALIHKPKGKASIVDEDDPRPLYLVDAKSGFQDLTGSDCI